MSSITRASLALRLAEWAGADVASLIEAGDGWPSQLRVRTGKGIRTVAAHMGLIGSSLKDGSEGVRRFQTPGPRTASHQWESDISLLLGLSEETEKPIIVGLDPYRPLERTTRQSYFMPLNQMHQAARDGWAEHVSQIGGRIVAFTPEHLPEYIELRTPDDREEVVYDSSALQRSSSVLITDVVPKIDDITAGLAERLHGRPQGVHELTPRQFEELIGELLTTMCCGRVELTRFSRDGGKDLLAYIDIGIGRMLCLVEVKKYRPDRTVGIEIVRSLYGVLNDEDASHATLVTTSSFSRDAQNFESRHQNRLSLRDYSHVAEWIQRYGVPKR